MKKKLVSGLLVLALAISFSWGFACRADAAGLCYTAYTVTSPKTSTSLTVTFRGLKFGPRQYGQMNFCVYNSRGKMIYSTFFKDVPGTKRPVTLKSGTNTFTIPIKGVRMGEKLTIKDAKINTYGYGTTDRFKLSNLSVKYRFGH